MANFLLIHGAWHGGWCWKKLVPLLEEHGHTVNSIDLPSHGSDRTSRLRVTLDVYGQAITTAAESVEGPVIAVGHSMGGLAISYAAEKEALPISKLIYLSAILPVKGENIRNLIVRDRESKVITGMRYALHRAGASVRRDMARELFYNDCEEKDANWAISNLCIQPGRPLLQRMKLARQRFRDLPRVYIKCLQDKVLSPAFQQAMCEAGEFDQVISMNTSHSPFLSSPSELAHHLHQASH